MGENPSKRAAEIAAIRLGVELGMTLIDTAEMYGSGEAERITAEAIRGSRDEVFLVSKVLPSNASRAGTIKACERSLERLETDRIDLYLLHWPGSHPLVETIAGFEHLLSQGKIGAWGVSNFDTKDMEKLFRLAGGGACATNQVLYNLGERGIEFDLVPWCAARNLPLMAYTPLGQGRILSAKPLIELAHRHSAAPATIALAFLLSRPNTIVIPKATSAAHVRANAAAATLTLSHSDLALLDEAFPPPTKKHPLAML